jgi:hypothetical protein
MNDDEEPNFKMSDVIWIFVASVLLVQMRLWLLMLVLMGMSAFTGYLLGVSRELTLVERRNIAIEYACGTGQNWIMMKFFCGSVK